MGKIVKPLLMVGAVAVAVVPGVNAALFGAALTATSAAGVGLTSALAIAAATPTVIMGMGAITALGEIQSALTPSPKVALAQLDRLSASVNPTTGRKFVFGENVAMATDIRYVEPWGDDQEYLDYIIAVAAHKVAAIRQIWIDDKLAWSSSGGVQGDYSGYLTVQTRLEGTAANTIPINGGLKWGSTRRLTGCAYVHLRIKRTGNSKKAESPFVGGLSSRITIIGDGMPVYDPRRDSTVPGGSGPQRANDCSTWQFDVSGNKQGANPILQALAYQLGWRINGKVSVGIGTPPERLNLVAYQAAANACDEMVTTSSGSQRRYVASGVFAETDDRQTVLQAFMTSCNAALVDSAGKLEPRVRLNDLASYVVDLTDDDVLGPVTWEPTVEIDRAYNVVRGRYSDPSANALYQLIDYPEVKIPSNDGQDRILTLDLPLVNDAARAQRIAKQVLQRQQYRGKLTAEFGPRAWRAKVGDVVRLTLSAAGFSNKLFRVESQTISLTGRCPMVLREENAAIYQWDADDQPAVTPAPPTVYNPLNNPFVLALDDLDFNVLAAIAAAENAQDTADGKIQTWYQNSAPTSGMGEGDLWIDANDANRLYIYRSGSWVAAADTRIAAAILAAAGAQATADGKVTTFYSTTTPTAEALGDLWYNSSTRLLKRWNGSAWVDVGTFGADWASNVTSRPPELTDGRVGSGLNSDGTIRNNRVSTNAVVDNSLTRTFGVTDSGTLTGSPSYAWQDRASFTITMTAAGDLLLWGDVQNAYAGGSLPMAWQIRFTVDGVQIGSPKGGAGWGTDTATIQRIATGLAAGSHTVKLQWRADNAALSCSDGTMFGMGRFNK